MIENLPPIDIKSFINTTVVLIIIWGAWILWRGSQAIRNSREINYFRMRREHVRAGWRFVFFGFFLVVVAMLLKIYGEPVAYRFIPVTVTPTLAPTQTLTPTITTTPTITLIPSITPTLSETYTPEITVTPYIPLVVEVMFEAAVTPPADAVFSPLTFSHGLDNAYQPIDPAVEFENPVGHLFASFSYDKLVDGVQWTALWFRDSELVYYETMVWIWGSGGLGFTDWEPDPSEWLPGTYVVQIFIGHEPKTSGSFVITGAPSIMPVAITPTQTPEK